MNPLKFLNDIKFYLLGATLALSLVIGGAYFIGHSAYQRGLNVSKVAISEYETKLTELDKQLILARANVTTKFQTQYVDRVLERERIVYRNRETIVTQVPEQYNLSEGWVHAHNSASQARPITPELASNPEPSRYTDKQALEVVTANYAICKANEEQLTALQNWYRAQQEATNEIINNR